MTLFYGNMILSMGHDATHCHEQLGLPDKGCAIKGLVVYNSWDLEPWDLLNGLALG